MTTATRVCATWLCKGRCTGRQKYCGDCRAERARTQAREARRVRKSMEHVGTIVPRVMHDIEHRTGGGAA